MHVTRTMNDDAARSRALLAATSAFLSCADSDAVGHAITDAIVAMFGPAKAGVIVADGEGVVRLVSATGYAEDEIARIEEALAAGSGLIRQVLAGEELWSDDPGRDEFVARIALYEGRSGFTVPIVTPGGIAGTLTGIYRGARAFDDSFRAAARSLAAQAGLAQSLIASREEAARTAAESARRQHRSERLFELSSALAGVHEPDRIPDFVCDVVVRASGSPFAVVAERESGGDHFAVAATRGLSPVQIARIEAALATVDRPSLRQLLDRDVASRSADSDVLAGLGLAHAMGAPIVIDGRSEGFIAIGAPPDEEVVEAEWHELLTAFAAVTATALGRAQAIAALADQRDALASEVAEQTRSLYAAVAELRRASEAKTEFLANVSHELRTPLTAILGFAEVLGAEFDGPLNVAQRRDLETIQASSRHLLKLINDLIDIASIESGRVAIALAPVDPTMVVHDAVETIRPLAGARGITLEVEAPGNGSKPPNVSADESRLREILLNLLSNAVKFTPAGGRVRVSLATDAETPAVRITVHDSGIGIAIDDRVRIFEKFTRIAGPDVPGTGLGLAISRELARLHRGDLTVESTPGLGSAFTVRIPVAGEQ